MARPGFSARADVAGRRAIVVARRAEHIPYAEIATDLGITEATARKDYERALAERQAELDSQRSRAVAAELAELDEAARAAWAVLRREHIVVQHGKVVRLGRKPLTDDAPVLNAIDRILKIAERRAKLRGLDAPVKVEVRDEVDAEIARLAAALAAGVGELEPAGEAEAAGDAAAG